MHYRKLTNVSKSAKRGGRSRWLFTLLAGAALAIMALLATAPGYLPVHAQNRMAFSPASAGDGHIALGLALRKLSVSGTFMQAAAHPDDETNALFAYFGYGQGLRVIDETTNRGEDGQNEIGPELFRDIAILRTGELLSAHRIDGAEQYFTRSMDVHYSFSPDEVIEKWGRKDMVGDYVRLWRMLRPDVIVTMNIQGSGGDRAHEAQTILIREAFRKAADPNEYPEQLKEGLRPWQPKKLYYAGVEVLPGGARVQGADAATLTPVPTGDFDPLLGRTYAEIGTDAHSNHKCQGAAGDTDFPPGGGDVGGGGGRGGGRGGGGRGGGRAGAAPDTGRGGAPAGRGGGGGGRGGGRGYSLVESTLAGQMHKQESSLFDGIDTSVTSIAEYAGPNPPAALTAGLSSILGEAKSAQSLFAEGNDAGTATPVEAGLAAVRALQAQLPSMGLSDSARYEIDFRLKRKERDYEDAVLAAHDLAFDATADEGLVIAGQPVRLSFETTNNGHSDVSVTGVDIAGFDAPARCAPGTAAKGNNYTCAADAHIPRNAKLTTPYFTDNYWSHPENQGILILDPDVPFGVPFAPSPFRVTFHVKAGNAEVTKELPIEYRYSKDVFFGEKRMELNVVPAFSVRVQEQQAVFPAPAAGPAAKPVARPIHVEVTNDATGPAQANVTLELPEGWKASPASVPLSFGRKDQALSAAFEVTAPAQVKIGDYTLRAVVTSPAMGDQKFSNGYQVIEYPHIERRQVIEPAEAALKVFELKTVPNLNVGYIMGVGDQVPPALEQLGAKVSFIDSDELASGDLSKHDVIVTGIRAYLRRNDLRTYNSRLLDYVYRGGTLIVQYNKNGEFNQAEYGPYPASVSQNRITDRLAPVKLLQPADSVFNFPNKIGPFTWANWTQERGLYFLGEKDPRYVDLISMEDSFKDNPGVKLGSLVEAKYGKGKWFYVALGLWRQVATGSSGPHGTDGAYQLLANLIGVPKAPAQGTPAKKGRAVVR